MRRLSRFLAPLAAVVFAAVLAAGCGSSGHKASSSTTTARTTSGGSTGGSTDAEIVIKNFAYSPSTLTVSPGSTVTVKNEDSATHTVTATGSRSGAFDTGDIKGGTVTTFKAPATPGTYDYICTIHQFMHGTLVVRS